MNSDEKELAILAYHKIGEPPPEGWTTWYYIPVDTFRAQLDYIQSSEWSVIDISTFFLGLEDPDKLPSRAAVLTFDDGCHSMHQIALPILQEFGFPAVLFVPTAYIGGSTSFYDGVEPEEPMCDWSDLKELENNGVSIQSHSVSHPWFTLLNKDERSRELRDSKKVLEEGLGRTVDFFAFPYSDSGKDASATTAAVKAAGYKAACLCGGGPATNRLPVADRFRLSRLAMYRDTDLDHELEPGQS